MIHLTQTHRVVICSHCTCHPVVPHICLIYLIALINHALFSLWDVFCSKILCPNWQIPLVFRRTNLSSQLPSLHWKPRSLWPSGILISFFTSMRGCHCVMVSWCFMWNIVEPEGTCTTMHLRDQRFPLPKATSSCSIATHYDALQWLQCLHVYIMWRYLEKP